MGHGIVGRGSRAGATASDGVTADYADRDGIPAPLPVVWGVWGAQAPWPATMPPGSFGPRVQATVGYLTGRIGARQREVQEILAPLGQTDVSGGSIGMAAQGVRAA